MGNIRSPEIVVDKTNPDCYVPLDPTLWSEELHFTGNTIRFNFNTLGGQIEAG